MPTIPQQHNQFRKTPTLSAVLGEKKSFIEEIKSLLLEHEIKMMKMIDERFKEIKIPNLDDVLQTVKGTDGEDSDPSEIADIILSTPEFIELTKAKDGHTPTRDELITLITPLIPEVEDGIDGIDGKDADETLIIERVMSLIRVPKDGEDGEDGKDGSPDKPKEIANKLNTLTEAVDQSVIKNLDKTFKRLERAIREKGGGSGPGKGGGGMGSVQHENTATSSATTTVTTSYKIAGNGNALWLYYNGQLLFKGTHYTVGSDQKTITFLITLQDSTNISIVYIRT